MLESAASRLFKACVAVGISAEKPQHKDIVKLTPHKLVDLIDNAQLQLVVGTLQELWQAGKQHEIAERGSSLASYFEKDTE